MSNKPKRHLLMILFLFVLSQRSFFAVASPRLATASTADWGETQSAATDSVEKDTGQRDTGETNMVKADIAESSGRNDIVQVVMPVNTEHVFDFIMDPQELIGQTDAAAYNGCQFEKDATLFFRRSDDEAEVDYSSSSDALDIVNKGDRAVKVVLTARVIPDSISGITMSDDPEFPDNTDASLYLALTDGETTVPVDRENGAVIETEIPGVIKGEDPNEYSFQLIGAVNKEGDWSEVADITPKITVTWMVSMGDEDILSDDDILDDDIPDEDILDEDMLDEDILDEENITEEKNIPGEGKSEEKEGLSGTVKGDESGESDLAGIPGHTEKDAVFPEGGSAGNKSDEETGGAVRQEKLEEGAADPEGGTADSEGGIAISEENTASDENSPAGGTFGEESGKEEGNTSGEGKSSISGE